MAVPMWTREPIVGRYSSGVHVGQLLSGLPGTWRTIVADCDEATLIEELAYSAQEFSTDAGQIVLGVQAYNAGVAGTVYVLGAYEVPAGTASLWASGRIPLNITLQVSTALVVAHNIQSSGGGGYTDLDILALGGIVR